MHVFRFWCTVKIAKRSLLSTINERCFAQPLLLLPTCHIVHTSMLTATIYSRRVVHESTSIQNRPLFSAMHYKILYAAVTMPALASSFFLHSKPTVVSFRTFPNTPSALTVTPTLMSFLFDRKLSRSLREAHSNAFPKDKNTYPNASTVELAKECVADIINAKKGCDYESKLQLQTL